jgi:hypothetical protein
LQPSQANGAFRLVIGDEGTDRELGESDRGDKRLLGQIGIGGELI